MITVALLNIYTLLQALMPVFFWLKCVKLTIFSILQALMRLLLHHILIKFKLFKP